MKTPEQVLTDVRRRLDSTWHLDATGAPTGADGGVPSLVNGVVSAGPDGPAPGQQQLPRWPHSFPIGVVSKAMLDSDFPRYQMLVLTWREWAAKSHVTLIDASRRAHGTSQRIPTHMIVPDADTAARLSGKDWVARLTRGRARAVELRHRFPAVLDIARVIRAVDSYRDADFDLLCAAAEWFSRNSGAGLTPRQVPIPGLHAKWLNTRHATVAAVAGLTSLDLLPPHPARLHFTYLDPAHRARGHRWHDSATVGDPMIPAYRPTTVVISENKDTALHFPELAGGISVEGVGYGGQTPAAFDWLLTCPNLFYWGDLDAAGFEILNGFRHAGLQVASLLMDLATFERYEAFGTATDSRGVVLEPGPRRALPHLTDSERHLYECLISPSWKRFRRVEQERIPLIAAADAVQAVVHVPG